MRMTRDFKPWAACSGDKMREVLKDFCYLDVEAELLVSTDGKILSKLPIRVEEGDKSGLIPVAALKEALRCAPRGDDPVIDCTSDSSVKLLDGRTWQRSSPGVSQYPQYKAVIPDYSPASGKRTVRLAINPVLLANLFAAAGNPQREGAVLVFELDDEWDAKNAAIEVRIGRRIEGVIMPMKIGSRAPDRIDDIEKAHEVAIIEEEHKSKKTAGLPHDVNAADVAAAS